MHLVLMEALEKIYTTAKIQLVNIQGTSCGEKKNYGPVKSGKKNIAQKSKLHRVVGELHKIEMEGEGWPLMQCSVGF